MPSSKLRLSVPAAELEAVLLLLLLVVLLFATATVVSSGPAAWVMAAALPQRKPQPTAAAAAAAAHTAKVSCYRMRHMMKLRRPLPYALKMQPPAACAAHTALKTLIM
jgi:hypothetical protein